MESSIILDDDLSLFNLFFLKNLNNKDRAIIKQTNSDTAVVIHIASPPNNLVIKNKLIVTNTKLLPREIIEENKGCSMATKNPEIIKLNPTNKNEIEYNLNTETVELNNWVSLGFINKLVILVANNMDDTNTTMEVTSTVLSPIFNKWLTLSISSAPK